MKSLMVGSGIPFQDIERSRYVNGVSQINTINADLDRLDRRRREGQNSKQRKEISTTWDWFRE